MSSGISNIQGIGMMKSVGFNIGEAVPGGNADFVAL